MPGCFRFASLRFQFRSLSFSQNRASRKVRTIPNTEESVLKMYTEAQAEKKQKKRQKRHIRQLKKLARYAQYWLCVPSFLPLPREGWQPIPVLVFNEKKTPRIDSFSTQNMTQKPLFYLVCIYTRDCNNGVVSLYVCLPLFQLVIEGTDFVFLFPHS